MNKITYILIGLLFCSWETSGEDKSAFKGLRGGYRERIVAITILEEAGRGEKAMDAIAYVIQNRVRYRNLSHAEVCLQPKQFNVWNGKRKDEVGEGAFLIYVFYTSPLYKSPSAPYAIKLAKAICGDYPTNILSDALLAHNDTTNGADHYYSKKMRGKEPSAVIGNHIFYNLSGIKLKKYTHGVSLKEGE